MKIIAKKNFTNGFVALLELSDGKRIETTATCLPVSTEMRGTDRTDNYAVDYNIHGAENWSEKAMIGVSTQSGCPVKCKFCAVNDLTEVQGFRNLSFDEIVQQVNWVLATVEHEHGVCMDNAQIFRVLFTRMGEPALNRDSVIKAARFLKEVFPKVRIQISTIGFGKHSQRLVADLAKLQVEFGEQFIELQFSIHSTSINYRQWLQHKGVVANSVIQTWVTDYHNILRHGGVEIKWKVTLNFALTTETPFSIVGLRKQFKPDDVFIKVSPINENVQTEKNDIRGVIFQTNGV
ncbi:radical SAM protein [Yersinia phage vB_YenM_P778]